MSNPATPLPVASSATKKRKLKHPRTTNACAFCRRRKVRCSGTQPCSVCVEEDVPCEYSDLKHVKQRKSHVDAEAAQTRISLTDHLRVDDARARSSRASSTSDAGHLPSRRASIEPPQSFVRNNHVGPTSGVSFLYHRYNEDNSQKQLSRDQEIVRTSIRLYGDAPLEITSSVAIELSSTQILDLLDKYFEYISPTYRFLHHPSLRCWTSTKDAAETPTTCAQRACVLLVCAQTLLHSPPDTNGEPVVGQGDWNKSVACFREAQNLLDEESGPPATASIQARLALCLYLLSTYRLNECRHTFSFLVSLATSLGLHRKQSSMPTRVSAIEGESRKRAFWSMYILDGYLSVMLGRPRLLHDNDIDQTLPYNFDDKDLFSSVNLQDLPEHGNLEGLIAHSHLAQLMAETNDRLYPLQSLSSEEILERSNLILDKLDEWQNQLPKFLKPSVRTMTGQRSFERQNTILKLAVSHLRILATRRCLLTDFRHVDVNPFSRSDENAQRPIRECIHGITMVIDTVEALIETAQCGKPFWSTQYIAIVAFSTLYVLILQGVKNALPGDIKSFLDVDAMLTKTQRCQNHLALLPPSGSQVAKHHTLLAALASKAQEVWSKRLHRRRLRVVQRSSQSPITQADPIDSDKGQTAVETHISQEAIDLLNEQPLDHTSLVSWPQNAVNAQGVVIADIEAPMNDQQDSFPYPSLYTPASTSDLGLYEIFDYGWESLDTVGVSGFGQVGLGNYSI